MSDKLPPEMWAFRELLADLHHELPGRTARLRWLIAKEAEQNRGRGLILPGGSPATMSYEETRKAFVEGNFLTVLMMSLCLLENVLAAHLDLEAISAEIHGKEPRLMKPRPAFRETVAACLDAGLIDDQEADDLRRLADLRNAAAHFRNMRDPSHLDRRSLSERRSAEELCEDDAAFAITVFVRMLAKDAFRFRNDDDVI